MKLRIDTRLPHDLLDVPADDPPQIQRNRAVYRITEVLAETPWSSLYRAKKVFHNFDFKDRRLVEVEDDECLDVFVKTLAYPTLDQRAYVSDRRDLAWFEAKKVLGCRKTNLIPEPLGFLEVRNDEDVFAFPRAGSLAGKEPILICEAIHGESLARWRQQRQPDLLQILRVLGELLDLIGTFHGEKMLINNVGPATFWIDAAHRVHFMGTENVVDRAKAESFRFLFPPERYSRGFAAPELTQPGPPPSQESDLFGWAAIAFFLITGQSPARIAAEQQTPWARFESHHRQLLYEALQSLNGDQIGNAQQWLGVEGTRFSASWPGALVDGLLTCLETNSADRPPDVEALRQWWAKAPPPRVSQALAIYHKEGRVTLQFSTLGLPATLTYTVRRKQSQAPRSLSEGLEVWSGTSVSMIEDVLPKLPTGGKKGGALAPWFYSVFSIDASGGSTSASLPRPVLAIDGAVPNYCQQFAEQAAARFDPARGVAAIPLAELEILAALETFPFVATELLGSQDATVRGWALQLLHQRLRNVPSDQACRQLLQQRGLADTVYQLRCDAAAILVRTMTACNVAFVVQVLAPALGGQGLDDRIRAVRGMARIGLSDRLVQEATRTFELDRPVNCEVCQQRYRAGDIDDHLIEVHRYVSLDGDVLPLREALKRLWQRVLVDYEPTAFQELVRQLTRYQGGQAIEALVASFRQQFLLLPETVRNQQRPDSWKSLARCLAADPRGAELCCHLLVDDDPQLNRLGQQFYIHRAGQELSSDEIDIAAFRRWLEFLAPRDRSEERIQICETLVALGANPTVSKAMRQELELNRVVLCPDCGESLQMKALGRHRRLQHQIFEFENRRFTLVGMSKELANRLFSAESNLFAALTIVELYEEQFAESALGKMTDLFGHQAAQLAGDVETRGRLLGCAASSLAPLKRANRLCLHFLTAERSELKELGLLLFGHLTSAPEIDLARRVTSLMVNADLGLPSRALAATALVRWSGSWPEVSRKGLLAYATGVSNDVVQKIDTLQTLQERTGPSQVIQGICHELAEKRRIRCPKCSLVFTGHEMPQHTLQEHQRIFDGRTLRRPWTVAVECLETYASQPDPALLTRGEELAQVEDPGEGLDHFIREALQRGIDPGHYRRTLEKRAENRQDRICPTCLEVVPKLAVPAMTVEYLSAKRLDSEFLSIRKLSDSPFWMTSEIYEKGALWSGPQPGWSLTTVGAVGLILVTTWGLAVGVLILVGAGHTGVSQLALWSFVTGIVAAGVAAVVYRPVDANVIDTAWRTVVPQLLKGNIDEKAQGFLAGLCGVSIRRGNRGVRHDILESTSQRFSQLSASGHTSDTCLGAIWRLRFLDALDAKLTGIKLIELISTMLQDALSGAAPLSALNFVASDGSCFQQLPEETLIALRWRLLQIVHFLEWSVESLFELAKHCAAVKVLLPDGECSIRAAVADAWAVLELAAPDLPPGCQTTPQLIKQGKFRNLKPNVDLLAEASDGSLLICSRGIYVEGHLYTSPLSVAIRTRQEFMQTGWTYQRQDGGADQRYKVNPPVGYQRTIGYELIVNGRSSNWNNNPAAFVAQINLYSALLFGRIKPRSKQLQSHPVTAHVRDLLQARAISCRKCGQPLQGDAGRLAGIMTGEN